MRELIHQLLLAGLLVATTVLAAGEYQDHRELLVAIEAQGECMADVYAGQQEQADVLDEVLANVEAMQTVRASVTAYTIDPSETDSTPNQAADMSRPIPGKTAAVSRDLVNLLGKRVYIPGHGVRVVNDLTADGLTSTVDLLVGNKKEAAKVGREVKQVVVL